MVTMSKCLTCKWYRQDETRDDEREIWLIRFWCGKTNIDLPMHKKNCFHYEYKYKV